MEILHQDHQQITTEQLIGLLKKEGMEVNLHEAKPIRAFLILLADILIEELLQA
ncbi:hypothetical protein [Pedobacter sp.]|uniref:hypothetical protein n=1 Tax=Pedobacter sp. TaxID=1411316 RepID=UPI003BAD99AB